MNYFSYFSEIEEAFVRRRGKSLLLSPLDWALIEAWKERGIPLHVVLRAIETVFDTLEKQPARKRSIKSLVYCRDEVENLFAVWLDARIGDQESPKSKVQSPKSKDAEPEIKRETIISHLQTITENLQRSRIELNGGWQQLSAEILSSLQTAQKYYDVNGDLEILESNLSGLDRQIDGRLPHIFSENESLKIKAETAAQLRSHKSRMNEEIYHETFKNLLIKNLRDRADLPRFSLFYL
ncbi:MAG: hypothetical protein ABI954_07720 [Pyrinomonadaceae bacterium]